MTVSCRWDCSNLVAGDSPSVMRLEQSGEYPCFSGLFDGLGHGLYQEAMREARQIKFRRATSDGHPVHLTTNIIIRFQLA